MQRLVQISGIWNVGVALLVGLLALRPEGNTPRFWLLILAGVLAITGVVLILASRDLPRRRSIVYYEGVARLIASALLLTLGPSHIGWLAWLIGPADLAWGLVQVVIMPRVLGVSHADLLVDR